MSWKIGLKEVPVVVGLIERNKKLLIAKRPDHKIYKGYWEFPGGKIEENESVEAALYRELKEELAIDVKKAHSCFIHTHPYANQKVLLHIWLVSSFYGEPKPQESQVLLWIELNELHSIPLLEGNLAIVDKICDLFN